MQTSQQQHSEHTEKVLLLATANSWLRFWLQSNVLTLIPAPLEKKNVNSDSDSDSDFGSNYFDRDYDQILISKIKLLHKIELIQFLHGYE